MASRRQVQSRNGADPFRTLTSAFSVLLPRQVMPGHYTSGDSTLTAPPPEYRFFVRGRQMKATLLALAAASCSAPPADEPGSGLTVFVSQETEMDGEFAILLDRGEATERLEPHRGIPDLQGFDYALQPGHPVTVRVSYTMPGSEATTLAVPIPAQNDITYSVYAHAGREDPTAQCIGCMDLQSIPLAGADGGGARLWLYTSFNGITHPIMF